MKKKLVGNPGRFDKQLIFKEQNFFSGKAQYKIPSLN